MKNSLIGTAGEHYAAGRLTEMGLFVTMTNKNTPGIDLLVSDGETSRMIQVKTTRKGTRWASQNMAEKIPIYFTFLFLLTNEDTPQQAARYLRWRGNLLYWRGGHTSVTRILAFMRNVVT